MRSRSLYFFLNDTATTKIYTLSLHDALPIYGLPRHRPGLGERGGQAPGHAPRGGEADGLATLHRSRRTGFLRREPVLGCRAGPAGCARTGWGRRHGASVVSWVTGPPTVARLLGAGHPCDGRGVRVRRADVGPPAPARAPGQIGRASCRERV